MVYRMNRGSFTTRTGQEYTVSAGNTDAATSITSHGRGRDEVLHDQASEISGRIRQGDPEHLSQKLMKKSMKKSTSRVLFIYGQAVQRGKPFNDG